MNDNSQRYWLWLSSGIVLDAMLAITIFLGVQALEPFLLQNDAGFRWRMALLGSVLVFVHLIMLPVLIWPAHELSTRDFRTVLVRSATIPPAAFLGVVGGVAAGLTSGTLLMAIGVSFNSFLSRTVSDIAGGFVILSAFIIGFFTGGAVSCGLVARGATRRANPDQIPLREHTAVLGGGLAALVLAVVDTTSAVKHLSDLDSIRFLSAELAVAAAGLSHLLLTCRDLFRQSTSLVSWPIASRRLFVSFAALSLVDASLYLWLLSR